ncbi:MAG: hypothetical protein IPJ34_08135 [Myxococcales bacterium]|nr:hypothetical protein [Myxococcales bacterium]
MSNRLARLSLAAFVVYGSWAAFANHGHGAWVAGRALLGQGLSSATTTLLIGGLVELLSRRLGATSAALLAATATACFHAAVNLLLGTPELLRTIAPSVVVGYAFALAYAVGVTRASAGSANACPEPGDAG